MSRSRAAEVRRSLATRRPRPPAPGDKRLTVVIPAFHEADRIEATVLRIRRDLVDPIGADQLEVVVVDDGSGDGTADAARRANADQVIDLPANRGKGAAVATGVAVATGRTIAFTDADLSYAPAQLVRFVAQVEDGWDIAVGNRHHHDTTTVVAAGWLREVGGRLINAATRTLLVGGHADTQCGIKAFRSDVAQLLFTRSTIEGFAFDIEIFFLAERYGLSLTEVPVEVENSASSTVRVARDAVELLADLLRIRRAASRGAYDLEPGELGRRLGTAE